MNEYRSFAEATDILNYPFLSDIYDAMLDRSVEVFEFTADAMIEHFTAEKIAPLIAPLLKETAIRLRPGRRVVSFDLSGDAGALMGGPQREGAALIALVIQGKTRDNCAVAAAHRLSATSPWCIMPSLAVLKNKEWKVEIEPKADPADRPRIEGAMVVASALAITGLVLLEARKVKVKYDPTPRVLRRRRKAAGKRPIPGVIRRVISLSPQTIVRKVGEIIAVIPAEPGHLQPVRVVSPHDRRGHPRTLRSGRVTWIPSSRVKGGAPASQVITTVLP